MATFLDRFRQNLPVDTSTSSLFPSLDQWLTQRGLTQADTELYNDETGTSQRRMFGNPAFSYYGEKYGLTPDMGSNFSLRSPVRQLESYEELLRMIQPGNTIRGGISELPYLDLTPEREREIIMQALSNSGGTRAGFDQAFNSILTPEELNVITQHRNYMPEDDFFGKYGPLLGTAAFGGLIGATGGFSGAGLDAYGGAGVFGGDIAGTAFAGEGLSGGLGGGMGFFDDILNWVSPNNSGFDFSNILSDTGSFAGEFSPLSTDWESLLQTIGSGNATLGGVFNSLTGGGLPSLGNSLRGLLGGGSGTGGGGLLGGLFGGTGGGFNPAATAAALAAINYAKNTDPFDTSRLESLYGQFNPSANAFQYDTNTGLGREELTSGLARRGISGSSFGDQSLTNYNTFRDLGRQSLLNQGIGTQADIASKILSSDVASRQMKNDLYGRALLALSGGLSPTNTSAFFGR